MDKVSVALGSSIMLRSIEREQRLMKASFGSFGGFEAARNASLYLHSTRGLEAAHPDFSNHHDYLRKLGGPLAGLSGMLEDQLRSTLRPSVLQGFLQGRREVTESRHRWDEVTRSLTGTQWSSVSAVASSQWITAVASLAENLQASGLAERNPLFADRLFAPYEAYGRFARGCLQSLEQAPRAHQASLSAALAFAGTEVHASASIIEEALDDEWIDESAVLINPPRPNVFRQLRAEVRVIEVPTDALPVDLILFSPTADLMDAGRRFAALVPSCNLAAEIGGRSQIFTYTSTLVESLHALPFSVATDRDTLARIVDALYFVLYEGAGSDALRYLAAGLLTKEECDVVWRIKHLRNKWLRHDPERGAPRDVIKNRTILRDAFSALGLSSPPRRRDDFIFLHRSLMRGAIEMLEVLCDRLARVQTE